MVGGHAQQIALACLTQHGFDVACAIHSVGGDKGKRHLGGKRPCNHLPCDLRLGNKTNIVRNMRRLQASGLLGPSLRQIKRPVDEGMAVPRHIGGKHADLAVGDLARRPRILARNPA